MIKYLRGDTVRIRTKEEMEYCPTVAQSMWPYAGMIARIEAVGPLMRFYEIDIDDRRHWWHETCFEEVNKREDMEYML